MSASNTQIATIEKLSHDGRGIARINGKTTFISGALTNEVVTFHYTRRKRAFDEAQIDSVLEASSARVAPSCPNYGVCGGCSLQHLDSSMQIKEKQLLFLEMLARTARAQPDIILPELLHNSWNYRSKARVSVRYDTNTQKIKMGFREKNNPSEIVSALECKILNNRIISALELIQPVIESLDNPGCIAQIELAAGQNALALIIRHLSELSLRDLSLLREYAEKAEVRVYLQPSGPDSISLYSPESIPDQLHYILPAHDVLLNFNPTDFTQVHADLNILMVDQAIKLLELESSDHVLDLYCGMGNFSLPIARKCAHVVGIEGGSAMVERAENNADFNGIKNTTFVCENLEKDGSLNAFSAREFQKVLLDPPRTGAQAVIKQMQRLQPKRIVYVSCHPMTLARDAWILIHEQGYRLAAAGVMDMFPHTAHVESMALFIK